MSGLVVLILALYLVGSNRNLFSGNFVLKARFSNLNGLVEGSNVLYAGVQAGTVKQLEMVDDSTIELTLLLNEKISRHVHQNAVVSIGSDGLMGNKIVNIVPGKGASPLVQPGDLLAAQPLLSTNEMLQTLSSSNNNIAAISASLKTTAGKISQSKLLQLMDDEQMAADLKATLHQARNTANGARKFTSQLNGLLHDLKAGKGAAGILLADTAAAANLKNTLAGLNQSGAQLQGLTHQLSAVINNIAGQLRGNTPAGVLLNDSTSALHIRQTLRNIDSATLGLQQNMEALKHNFLLRGYFKAKEKAKKKTNEKVDDKKL